MIEKIKDNTDLFELKRAEGTIIHLNNDYWMYETDFEVREDCDKETESKGWRNVTNIIQEAKKEVFDDIEKECPSSIWEMLNKEVIIPLKQRHLSTFENKSNIIADKSKSASLDKK